MKFINKIKKENILVLFFFILAFFFQIYPFEKLFIKGIYNWHIQQPETVEGLIEITIYFFLLTIINLFFERRVFIFLLVSMIIFYFYNHGTLVPMLLAIIYFESLILSGRNLLNFFKIRVNISRKIFYGVIFGMCFWMLVIIFISALGFGTIRIIKIVTIVLIILNLIYAFGNKTIEPFLIVRLFKKIFNMKKINTEFSLILILIILIQVSKSKIAFDYDSIWYGLRPEYVLVGKKSFYDNLGLLQFVHYYPKFQEVLYLPLSNLGDYSYIYSANICVFILLIIYSYILCGFFKIFDKKRMLILVLIFSTPTIANFASTAKTDLLTVFILLFVIDNFLLFLKNCNYEYLIFSIIGLIISTTLKQTAFIYMPFLLSSLFLIFILNRNKKKSFYYKENKKKIIYLVLLVIMVVLGIHFRTYLLTGYPIYPLLQSTFKKIGIKGNYPFNLRDVNLENSNMDSLKFKDIIYEFYRVFFNPSKLPHVIMAWVGNLILFLYTVILFNIKKMKFNKYIIISFPVMFSYICYIVYFKLGGDGNYYIFPIIVTIILMYSLIKGNLNKTMIKKINICILLFFPFQFIYTLVSHSSWAYGTGKINTNINQPLYSSNQLNRNCFEYNELLEVENYIKENKLKRGLGYDGEGGLVINRLPIIVEDLQGASNDYLGVSEVFETNESFNEYINFSKIQILIIPKNLNKIQNEKIRNFLMNYSKDKKKIDFKSWSIIKVN